MRTLIIKILLLYLLLIFPFGAYTQNNIDSLRKVLETQKEDTNRVNTLNWLAGSYVLMDDRKNGMEYANQALFLSKKINFKKGKGEAYHNIGFIYMLERNFDDAHKNARLALVIMEDIGSKAGISACYDVIRSLYTVQDNIPEAIRYSYLKFKIDEEIGDKKGMGESLYSIGYLYSSLHNDAEALKNYLASYKVHEEIGDKELIAVSAIRLGDIYYNQGNYNEALKYDSVALRIYQKLGRGQLHGLPNCYLNIGKVFAKLGETAYMKGDKATVENSFYKAKENFLATLKLCDEYKDTAGVADAYLNLGKLNIKLSHFYLARKYLEKSLQLFKIAGEYITESLSDNYMALATLDSIEGNFKQAYDRYKMHIFYRDSIGNEENIRKSEGYKMQYEFDKKEDEIKLLSTQNKLQTALAQQQSQRKNFAYTGIGVILIAGSYGFYRFRKRKRLQNQQALMNERLRISRELHDEVGATLSGIAMYSHLTKEQIKQSNTIEVEKSLNIMQQSAGEMVNKLNDIVWLINPDQDSLQKLIQRLEEYARDMAAIKNMQVKVNVPTHLAEHSLPVESRRNIYLFCKEAINNAVKYSNGTLLELNIKEEENKLEFSVSDNGKGFDAVMVRRGNGLENMQKRADEIGAKLILQSKKDEGSLVSMQIKITH